MTLEEWKRQEEAKRVKSQFKIRKANEGADMSQWKGTQMYRKAPGTEDSDEEEEETDDEDVSGPTLHARCSWNKILNIKVWM